MFVRHVPSSIGCTRITCMKWVQTNHNPSYLYVVYIVMYSREKQETSISIGRRILYPYLSLLFTFHSWFLTENVPALKLGSFFPNCFGIKSKVDVHLMPNVINFCPLCLWGGSVGLLLISSVVGLSLCLTSYQCYCFWGGFCVIRCVLHYNL